MTHTLILQADVGRLPLADHSIDAIVTDPPYGLSREPDIAEVLTHWLAGDDYTHTGGGFMGKTWDSFVPGPAAWREAWRALKPGGHLLAFSGTRTVDLLTIALRLAGFEIRDTLHWVYAQGFPKSLDVSKAIDKAAGAERKIIGQGEPFGRGSMRNRSRVENGYRPTELNPDGGIPAITAPATPDAERWQGWATALKPAHEPIVLARKPLSGTVAASVLAWGTGALNVDATRVSGVSPSVPQWQSAGSNNNWAAEGRNGAMSEPHSAGRWPPNLLLSHVPPSEGSPGCVQTGTRKIRGRKGYPNGPGGANPRQVYEGGDWQESWTTKPHAGHAGPDGLEETPAWDCQPSCPVAKMDRQSGNRKSGWRDTDKAADPDGGIIARFEHPRTGTHYADQGGASRFFPQFAHDLDLDAPFRYVAKASTRERNEGLPDGTRNRHATVKPVNLMRWLARLVTPPGGTLLDPFCGSGTTLVAATLEGFNCVGCDLFRAEDGGTDTEGMFVTVVRAEHARTLVAKTT